MTQETELKSTAIEFAMHALADAELCEHETPQPHKPLTDELIAYGKTASEMMASDQTRFDAACEVLRYLKQERVPYYYLHRMLTVIHGNERSRQQHKGEA